MTLFETARARQRRRRRAIRAVVLALGIAGAVIVVGSRGSSPTGGLSGLAAAAGAPSSTDPTGRTLTVRDFVKYGIDCQTLRLASIPIGPHMKWWCRAPSLVLAARKQPGPTDPLTGIPQLH